MRVLGVDYGRRRIGLALSDPTGLLARPWKTIAADGDVRHAAAALATELADLSAHEEAVDIVVVGYPRRLGGEANNQTRDVETLAKELRARLSTPIVLQDERLTSREADELLARRVKGWRERKTMLDAVSAAVILQDYLDGRPRGASAGGEDDC